MNKDKKFKKKSGKCPICNQRLFKNEQELLEKIGLDKSEQITEKQIKNSFKNLCKDLHTNSR